MTRNILFPLAIMALGVGSAIANVPGLPVGVLDCDLPKASPFGTDDEGILKTAMLVSPSLPAGASDLKLVNVRFGLTSKLNVEEVTIWASYGLNDEPFMSYTVDSPVVKGWNEVDLPEGISYNGKSFYLGYTIKTAGPSYPVAVIEGIPGIGFAFDNSGKWEYYDAEIDGMPAISAKIDGQGMEIYDLGISSIAAPSIINSRTPNQLTLDILNAGSRNVTGFTIKCIENGEEALTQEWTIPMEIESNRRGAVTLDFLPLSHESMSEIPFNFEITAINEGIDWKMGNNSKDFMAAVSPYSFEKRLMVEEYTSETCGNCPNAAAILHDAMAIEKYHGKVLAVCHHAGFQDDYFTQPCDRELVELFGVNVGTYNPAMSFDRLNLFGSVISHVPGSVKDMQSVFDLCLDRPAPVDFEVTGIWNRDTEKLEIKVEGMSFDGTIPANVNALTVYLLEDGVKPKNPRGQMGADENFRHSHLIRAYNSTWGDPIEWTEEGRFIYTVEFDVPEAADRNNMSLVATAGKFNEFNHFDCEIANSALASSIDWIGYSNVETPANLEETAVTYYDLTGRKLSAPSQQIVIKVVTYADGTQKSTKVIL